MRRGVAGAVLIVLVFSCPFGKRCGEVAANELTCDAILSSHDHNKQGASRKYSDFTVLGFVTPWNVRGTDVALQQANQGRLDVVSPVTWQMHPRGLSGGGDFEPSFHERIFKAGAKVYPRILFERWSLQDFRKLKQKIAPVVQDIVRICAEAKCEGVVLEIWQAMLGAGVLQGSEKEGSINLITSLGERIQALSGLHTVLVLPPYESTDSAGGVEVNDFAQLDKGFTHFVVMTYDYSSSSKPGPMAPLPWVRRVATFLSSACRLGRKVLIGLNFYGLEYTQLEGRAQFTGQHIVGDGYLALLEKHKPKLLWIEAVGEHGIQFTENDLHRVVFFPTRKSIALRVHVARETGCGGVAIWELGQGLDHFFDEF